MIEDAKIRKGLGPKRSPISYQTTRDIMIPAGTMLRSQGDDIFSCQVESAELTITVRPGDLTPRDFKQVIAS